MGLEVADWIDELISANPTVADPVAQGDDHIRLIKQVLQNAFPGNTAPLTFVGNMNLNGDYNGTNATMTGTVQGATITDGTYTLAEIGGRGVDAWGLVLTNATFDGFGIDAVSVVEQGTFRVVFTNVPANANKQVPFIKAHTSNDSDSYQTDIFNLTASTVEYYLKIDVGGELITTQRWPHSIIRMVLE